MTLDPGSGLSASTMTTADGRTLRYVHAGDGGPVVVFEAGLGGGAGEWVAVQRLVSAATRTVSYDRAGHGGSTPDVQDRTVPRICEDLHALVGHVSPDAPIVLVAHSWGGPMLRCYAEQHTDRVAGLVLVDTTTTAVMSARMARFMPLSMSCLRGLRAVGLAKPLTRSLFKKAGPELSAGDRAVIAQDLASKRNARSALAEAKAIGSTLPLMARWEQAGLPDVPVICVMGAGTGGLAAKYRPAFIATVEKEMANHPQGECRVIEGTDHYVPQDKPVETAQTILDVVQRVRDR